MIDDERKRADAEGETPGPEEAESGFPEPPLERDEDRRRDADPHHALGNPVDEPDPTEWPDPYDTREDPRAPDGRGHSGDRSSSEPHPSKDLEAEHWEGPKKDKLDE